jgi:hypothetical protein
MASATVYMNDRDHSAALQGSPPENGISKTSTAVTGSVWHQLISFLLNYNLGIKRVSEKSRVRQSPRHDGMTATDHPINQTIDLITNFSKLRVVYRRVKKQSDKDN